MTIYILGELALELYNVLFAAITNQVWRRHPGTHPRQFEQRPKRRQEVWTTNDLMCTSLLHRTDPFCWWIGTTIAGIVRLPPVNPFECDKQMTSSQKYSTSGGNPAIPIFVIINSPTRLTTEPTTHRLNLQTIHFSKGAIFGLYSPSWIHNKSPMESPYTSI